MQRDLYRYHCGAACSVTEFSEMGNLYFDEKIQVSRFRHKESKKSKMHKFVFICKKLSKMKKGKFSTYPH